MLFHRKRRKKLTALYTLDGNAQFPIAVNAVNPNKPLPLIVGIGYVSDKAYVIEERMRDYTFPVEGAEFAKGGKAADFLRFIQQDVKPYIEQHFDINKENNISLAILWWVVWIIRALPSTRFISTLHIGKPFSLVGEWFIFASK